MMKARNDSFKWKLFLSYVLIISCQIILLWGVGFSYIRQQLRGKQEIQYKGISDIILQAYEQSIESARNMTDVLIRSNFVKWLTVAPDSLSDYDVLLSRRELMNQVSCNPFVEAAFIYAPSTDSVISSFSTIESLDLFLKYDFKLLSFDTSKTKDFLRYGKNTFLEIGHANLNNTDGYYLLMIWPDINNGNNQQTAKVGVVVSLDKIKDTYNEVFPQNSVLSFAYNQERYFLTSSCQVSKEEAADIQDELTNNKDNYFVYDIISEEGITLQMFVNKITLYSDITSVQTIMIFILLLCLIIAAIIIYIVSVYNFRPVGRVLSLMNQTTINKKNEDTFTLIEREIFDLTQKEKTLTESLMDSAELVNEFCIKKLLLEENSSLDEVKTGLRVSGISFQYAYFNTMKLKLFENSRVDESVLLLPKELHPYKIYLYFCKIKKSTYAILINYEEQNIFHKFLEAYKQQLEESKIGFIGGVGLETRDLENIHISFTESEKAIEYRAVDVKDEFIYSIDIQHNQQNYIYKEEEVTTIISFLKSGESKKALSLLSDIFEQNKKAKVSVLGLKNLCIRVMFLAFSASVEHQININDKFNIQMIYDCNESTQLLETMSQIFEHTAQSNHIDQESHAIPSLYGKIVKFIDEHYLDADLSLTKTAEALNLHRVYVSTIFNENAGSSFTEYVNRKRVNHAALLLQEQSSYRISYIVEKSGFSSEATFRREFKRYLGISPSDYRSLVGKTN